MGQLKNGANQIWGNSKMGEVLRGNSKMGDLLVGQLKIVIILQRHAEICKFILLLWFLKVGNSFSNPLGSHGPARNYVSETISTLVSPPWYPIQRTNSQAMKKLPEYVRSPQCLSTKGYFHSKFERIREGAVAAVR